MYVALYEIMKHTAQTRNAILSPTVWSGRVLKLSNSNPICKSEIYISGTYIFHLHTGFQSDNLSNHPFQTVGLKVRLSVAVFELESDGTI